MKRFLNKCWFVGLIVITSTICSFMHAKRAESRVPSCTPYYIGSGISYDYNWGNPYIFFDYDVGCAGQVNQGKCQFTVTVTIRAMPSYQLMATKTFTVSPDCDEDIYDYGTLIVPQLPYGKDYMGTITVSPGGSDHVFWTSPTGPPA